MCFLIITGFLADQLLEELIHYISRSQIEVDVPSNCPSEISKGVETHMNIDEFSSGPWTHRLSSGHLCIGWSGGALDTRDMSKEGALQPGGTNWRSLGHSSVFPPQCMVLSGLGHIILTNQHTGQCVDLDCYRLEKLTQAPENRLRNIIFTPTVFLQ